MSTTSGDDLKRLFAQAPLVGADDDFVAQVAAGVVARRRALRMRRAAVLALLGMVAAGGAALLAPVAPSAAYVSAMGDSLLNLPDQIGNAAAQMGDAPGAWYLRLVLAVIVLPLAGVAWLSRRA
ncbi:MAG: hypothetical protein WDO12_11605 [Pseudomonadota bacterium]